MNVSFKLTNKQEHGSIKSARPYSFAFDDHEAPEQIGFAVGQKRFDELCRLFREGGRKSTVDDRRRRRQSVLPDQTPVVAVKGQENAAFRNRAGQYGRITHTRLDFRNCRHIVSATA